MFRWVYCVDEAALRHVPEMALFPTAQDRRNAVNALECRPFLGHRSSMGSLLAGFTVAISALLLQTQFFRSLPRNVPFVVFFIVGALGLLLGRLVSLFLTRADAARSLRSSLLKCGVPVCLECGYCVRGVIGERCPECGRELDTRVKAILAAATGDPARRDVADGTAPLQSRL